MIISLIVNVLALGVVLGLAIAVVVLIVETVKGEI
jgi:hypothetical protein